jgi:hypothetical protein
MIDAQPSSATVASLIVLVTGHLIVDGNADQPMPYSQMFQVSRSVASADTWIGLGRMEEGASRGPFPLQA